MMRLPKFVYHTPRTIAEAVKIIGDTGPDAQFVAGGTDLYPNMKRRQQTPRTVISVMRVPELNQISGDGKSGIRIGASVTLTDIVEHPLINRDYPVVAHAARTISTPILRNMGTIGGNLLLDTRCNYYDQNYEWRKGINFCLKKDGDVCWVAPGSSKCWAVQSSDLVPVMVAIGAKFRLVSTLGERMVDAAGFYNDDGIDYLQKRADELLVDIHLPPTNECQPAVRRLASANSRCRHRCRIRQRRSFVRPASRPGETSRRLPPSPAPDRLTGRPNTWSFPAQPSTRHRLSSNRN